VEPKDGKAIAAESIYAAAASFGRRFRLYVQAFSLREPEKDKASMRGTPARHWVCMLSLYVAATVFPAIAKAQMQDDQTAGGTAFAGGQMVRGTVTAVTAGHLTLKTETGEVYQVAVTTNTRMMKARQPLKLADVKAGDGVGAMGVLDAGTKTVHAVFVTVVSADEVKKAREGLGKVYIAGTVTAINELKVSVKRTDGVVQVIEVDEGTSFRRGGRGMAAMMSGDAAAVDYPAGGIGNGGDAGGESITLADVKVGDVVMGQGGLKGGVFVPTLLRVGDAAAAGQRRRRSGGGAGAGVAASAGAAAQPQ
jgi:hypothetical protein